MDNEDKEYFKEMFDQYHNGEISIFELMDNLETDRFDGDVFDYL
jgi:hypothetical protein